MDRRFERNGFDFFLSIDPTTESKVGSGIEEKVEEPEFAICSWRRSKRYMAATIGRWVTFKSRMRVLRRVSAGRKSRRGRIKINGIRFYIYEMMATERRKLIGLTRGG